MTQYLLLRKVKVQNANAIAGLTYGFPAITNFLGFAHALSRKLPAKLDIRLAGVAVVSHKNLVHARQPKGWGDYVFALTRNPLTQQGNTAPINEEGRMNMLVSMLIEIDGLIAGDAKTVADLVTEVTDILPTLRLAGGQILTVEQVEVVAEEKEQQTLRSLLPGFVLRDRYQYLAEHYEKQKQHNSQATLFEAWCDFAMLSYQAEKLPQDDDAVQSTEIETLEAKKTEWKRIPKPAPGYLVPLNTGYCAISAVYEPGEVKQVRDTSVPVVFAESVYSVGEWMSPLRLNAINDAIWRYENQYPWYVARSEPFIEDIVEPDDIAPLLLD